MIQYTKDGLVTNEAPIAVMFLGRKEIDICIDNEWFCDDGLGSIQHDTWTSLMMGDDMDKIRIPWPLVCDAIQPVEGEGCVVDATPALDSENLRVLCYPNPMQSMPNVQHYHKRVLNIVTTRAELRELVARCKGGER